MHRRTVLAASGFVASVAVAGCFGSTGPDGSGESDDTDDGEPNNGADSGDINEPAVAGMHLEVLGTHESSVAESAAATIENAAVTVRGSIVGRNACYSADLDTARIEDDVLSVNVESYEDAAPGERCLQTLVGIDYECVVTIAGDPPTAVDISHDGNHVTTERLS
ncbi:MAG: hypothetical protein M8354_14585 [Halalkalicoccus sp.]|nr:hypothetical protein [Halalkalicoccus sp.]